MATETTKETALGELYQFGMMLLCATGIALYLRILRNRADWVKIEAALGVLFALGVPLARTALSFCIKTNIDQHSVYLLRMQMILFAFQALVFYFTQNAIDPSVAITVSISSILMRGGVLLCYINGLFYVKTIANPPLQVCIVVLCLFLLGNFFQLSKLSTREGHLTVGDPISWHLSFDAMVTFLLGAWLFGFSEMSLQMLFPPIDIQCHHLVLCKVFGCCLLSGSLLSFGALTFKNTEDSLVILKSKFLAHFAAVVVGLVHFISDKNFMTSPFFLVLFLIGALAFNSCHPVWEDEKKKKQH